MASAAEQLAANLNFGAFAKAADLKKRIWFTLAALIVYRIGCYIPLPGIDPHALAQMFQRQQGGILDMFNMFSGGAFQRMTVFALNIMPYVSSSIIIQVMTIVSPQLEALKKEGEAGRKKMTQYTRYLTVFLSAVQAYGLAISLQNGGAVIDPGIIFLATTVVTMTGGTIFLMWLGEQITSRGIGNGISLIIFAGIVAQLPQGLLRVLTLGSTGALSYGIVVAMLVMAVMVFLFIVFMERAQRRILVQYPKRQQGNRMFGGESSHMPLKLNTSGVIPPIFASSLLLLPLTIVNLMGGRNSAGSGAMHDALNWITGQIGHGRPLYMVLYAAGIVFFCFFYTAIVFNPVETADNLRKYGGFILGKRPGKATADYLDYVLTRITVVGSAYLVVVCLIPELVISNYNLPFYFGGTSLLICVTVTMDTVAQIHSHLLAHQYEGLIKRAKLRGSRSDRGV
ncbi:MAG TPA: preprotein translocase subunit SecY [Alphaproteobacteria bacterium]|nr:preprotein translocase subunit SecY [Alphaproteobacteria bacterium]